MKVQDVMSRDIECCTTGTDLAAAAMVMWRKDCGVVPVTDDGGHLRGMITDRDICMAVATRHQPPESLRVDEVMSDHVYVVHPGDDVKVAMDRMREQKVRRMPVLGEDGQLMGMLSVNDLVLTAEPGTSTSRKGHGVSAEHVLWVMKGICEHQHEDATA